MCGFRSFVLLVLVVLSACVDHDANAATFCASVADVVDASGDDQRLSAEQAEEIADDVAKAMRTAEDSTRSVRSAARDLTVGYDELADLLGDDDATAEELDEAFEEVSTARADVRAACADR